MADTEPVAQKASAAPAQLTVGDGRKVYERPRILSREPLEVMAATCTKPFGKAPGICSTGRS